MKIAKVLKEYKQKKAEIESTLARINHYKNLLKMKNLETLEYYSRTQLNLNIQRTNTSSPVENEALDGIEKRNLTHQLISEWISEDRIKIYPIQIEIEQINIALTSLTNHEKYIIELKYFDNKSWTEIEISFNNSFGTERTNECLSKKHDEALRKLYKVLNPFYNRFSYKKST